PRIVHQNVQSTEPLHGLLNEREAGGLTADIGLQKKRFAATRRNLSRHAVTPRRIAVRKRHLSPLGDEAPPGGLPDTRCPAGYCGDHSIQLSHPPCLLVSCGEDTNAIRRGTGTIEVPDFAQTAPGRRLSSCCQGNRGSSPRSRSSG